MPWCKNCGKSNFWRDGRTRYGQQLYKCRSCGFRFVWCSDLSHRRFFSNVIDFAVEMYTSLIGISLRTVTSVLRKVGVKVSHEALRLWVIQNKNPHFVDDKVNNAQTWHCDETYIRVKGHGYWLWVVYCQETRQILSWHISPSHLLKDAKAVLQKAKQLVGNRPEHIITDGLWQYNVAIKKVMGWSWIEHKQKYTIHNGIGKNALIEQVNREIKRRLKWFYSFHTLRSTEPFFKLFFTNFNHRTALARNTG